MILECLHSHIRDELDRGSKTDTIVVIAAILYNLVMYIVIGTIASNASSIESNGLLVIFVIMSLLINFVTVKALQSNKDSRHKLLLGLLKIYGDQNVETYYDSTLLHDYSRRYNYFTIIIVGMGFAALLIPLIIRT